MRIFLKNIGKIQNSTIELNGITVVAGENNTGKSTIGKTLFAVFNSFYDINSKIDRERKNAIETFIQKNFHYDIFSKKPNLLNDNFIDEIVDELIKNNILNLSDKDIKDIIINHIEEDLDNDNIELINKLPSKIKDVFNVSSLDFIKNVLGKNLLMEFDGQICNIFSKEDSEIILTIKEKDIKINIKDNNIFKVNKEISLGTEVIYIDNPFIIDDIDSRIFIYRLNRNIAVTHSEYLITKLNSINSSSDNIINKIIIERSFKKIFNKINLGDLVNVGSKIKYKGNNVDSTMSIRNLSTGIKSFMIIKTLLLNGNISENGTIVLDEPEVHLHPEWQLIFAELIVLLQKEFGLHILLTTHSPYFLNAIEVYSKKYSIDSKCKFYLSENVGDISEINDVTDNLELIYEKLAKPFQILENEGNIYE